MRNSLFVLVTILLLLVTSCNNRPEIVIDEETMTNLLTDIHMAEGLLEVQTEQSRDDEYGQGIREAVLQKYGITHERLDTSLVWYSQNLKYLIRIYNHVNENLTKREEEWNLAANQEESFGKSPSGNKVNLWRLSPSLVLDQHRRTDYRQWRFTADTAYHAGDTIRWSLNIPYVPNDVSLVASLSITKKDKNLMPVLMDGVTTDPINRDTTLTLTCVADQKEMIDQIFASLNLIPRVKGYVAANVATCDSTVVAVAADADSCSVGDSSSVGDSISLAACDSACVAVADSIRLGADAENFIVVPDRLSPVWVRNVSLYRLHRKK